MRANTETSPAATTSVAAGGHPLTERQEDAADAAVLAEAKARGFRLAIRCGRCGQWLVAAESVALHMGPTCRRKTSLEGKQADR